MKTAELNELVENIAKICFYAQDHHKYDENGKQKTTPTVGLEKHDHLSVVMAMETVSHVVACLLANGTDGGRNGVESLVVFDRLCEYNHSYSEWLRIAEELVDEYK